MSPILRLGLCSLVAVIAPPLAIYGLAASGAYSTCSPAFVLLALQVTAWLIGMAALSGAQLRRKKQFVLAAAIYTLLSVMVLPLLTLSASCAFGQCCL